MTIRTILVFAFCTVAFSAFADTDPNQVDVAVPAHDIARGSVLGDSDLSYASMPALRVNSSIVKAIADAAGMETRRALRAGELIRASDLKHPTMVAKGSSVTMTFEAQGMVLTAMGRAMAEGGEGEIISVLNPTSFRQVQAVVIAPGKVRVGEAFEPPSRVAVK